MILQEQIKNIKRLLNFVIKEEENNDLIIKAGTELFHGTIEGYDKRNLRVGGYDKIFWTTTDPLISQTYIPAAGITLFTTTDHIANPSDNDEIQSFQKSIGINYDYSQVEFDNQSRYGVKSFREAPIFEKISKRHWDLKDLSYKIYKEIENIKKELNNRKSLTRDEEDKLFKKWGELEDEDVKINQDIKNFDKDKIKNQYVNLKLKKLGYEPTYTEDTYRFNYGWRLKIDKDTVNPKNYKAQGRLLIIKPKRDLKIYDTTQGETREPDLTDVDYHKHNWFESAKNSGYDGIKISDFAQSENWGNVGHYSIGLFQSTLKDVTADEIKATHQDMDFDRKDNTTPEYLAYKQKLNEEMIKIKKFISLLG